MKGRNAPILVELTPELAEFLVENCESNMTLSLSFMQLVGRETAERLVEQTEKYKELRRRTKAAIDES